MQRLVIALFGMFLFVSGIFLGFGILQSRQQAVALDKEDRRYGAIIGDVMPCSWQAIPPERVFTENETQAVVVQATNPLEDQECRSAISLRAPGFDISPLKEEQQITVPAQSKGSLAWVLAPHKTGTYQITVSDVLDTKVFGVTVTNVFGLSAAQAQLFSLLGTLFGPIFTVPWWLDKWRERKEKQKAHQAAA